MSNHELLNLTDAHCHLDENVQAEFEKFLIHFKSHGITKIVTASTNATDYKSYAMLAAKHPGVVFTTIGVHPWQLKKFSAVDLLREIEPLLENAANVVAIGELGLDYSKHMESVPKPMQTLLLIAQLEWALKIAKPIVCHCVKAHEQFLHILKEYKINQGQLHGFRGSKELASRYLDLGFYISLGPQILRGDNSEIIQFIPTDRLLIESDEINSEVAFPVLCAVFEKVLNSKKLTRNDLAAQLHKNAKLLFWQDASC